MPALLSIIIDAIDITATNTCSIRLKKNSESAYKLMKLKVVKSRKLLFDQRALLATERSGELLLENT